MRANRSTRQKGPTLRDRSTTCLVTMFRVCVRSTGTFLCCSIEAVNKDILHGRSSHVAKDLPHVQGQRWSIERQGRFQEKGFPEIRKDSRWRGPKDNKARGIRTVNSRISRPHQPKLLPLPRNPLSLSLVSLVCSGMLPHSFFSIENRPNIPGQIRRPN